VNPKLKLLFKPRNLPLTLSLLIVILAIPLTVGLALSKTLYNLTSSAHQLRQATKPVCNIRIINKKPSDGWWRWLDEKREVKHKYEKGCKKNNCQALCKNAGTKSEGWYSSCTNKLILFDKCGVTPTPSPTPQAKCPPNIVDIKLSEADNGKTISAYLNQTLSLTLEENASTGYRWDLKVDSKYLKLLCQATESSAKCQLGEECPPIVGALTTTVRYYQVLEGGQTSIAGVYCRPWDCQNTTQKKLNIYLTIYPKPTPTPYLNTPHPSSIPSFETSTP
jgi:predicted secreted protein